MVGELVEPNERKIAQRSEAILNECSVLVSLSNQAILQRLSKLMFIRASAVTLRRIASLVVSTWFDKLTNQAQQPRSQ
jgi:hypothetical protein